MRLLPKGYKSVFTLGLSAMALLVFLQCIVPDAVADDVNKIQLIELKHRSAAEILQAIKPHLSKGTIASEQDQKIVLSGKAASLEQIEVLIDALDQPVQSWRVFFAQGQVNLQVTQQKNTRNYSTARSEVFEVLVREGATARLERGFWIPVQISRGDYRETGYEWLSSGFWVAVKPVGDQLILNLTSQQATPGKKTMTQAQHFSGRQFESEVALQLGQWITLGSEAQLAAQIPDASRRYKGGSSNEYYSICIEASNKVSCPR